MIGFDNTIDSKMKILDDDGEVNLPRLLKLIQEKSDILEMRTGNGAVNASHKFNPDVILLYALCHYARDEMEKNQQTDKK